MFSNLRRRLYSLLETNPPKSTGQRLFAGILTAVILINVGAVVLGSEPAISQRHGGLLWTIEILSVAFFTVEYGVRIWVAAERHRDRHPLIVRLRFIATPMALVDLLAIAPFYLASFIGIDLRFLRALRLLRLFKLSRYFSALDVLGTVLAAEARAILAALFVMCIMIVVASSAMHIAEAAAQPEAFGSIPRSMWWAVVTLTTVGYGDVTPVTLAGRLISVVIMIMGIGMVALPAGMLASRFSEELGKRRDKFREEVHSALSDGQIDDDELSMLADLRHELCLSADDSKRILERARAERHQASKN